MIPCRELWYKYPQLRAIRHGRSIGFADSSMTRLTLAALVVAVSVAAFPANAASAEDLHGIDQQAPGWYFQGGAYLHYRDDEDYQGPPLFAGVEYHRSAKWLHGFAMFQNSFGQFSQYAYTARMFRPLKSQPYLHIKITGGLVHGYSGKHHDTLPVRWGDSWGLGIIPTIGYKKDRLGVDFAFLKASALMVLVGYHF